MAERLTDAQAEAFLATPPRRGPSVPKYPWHQWCDGAWWRIEQGEDFDTTPHTMSAVLAKRAARYEWEVQVCQRKGTLVFRFIRPPVPERAYRLAVRRRK